MPTVGELLVRVGVVTDGVDTRLNDAANKFERWGTRVSNMGSRITQGFSLPIAGAAALVTKLGMDFDKAMTESLAIMDGVDAGLRQQMEETAFTIARTTKFGASVAAEAYYDLASAGLTAEESMGSLATVAQFAQAGVMDLASAGDYLAGATVAVGNEALGVTDKIAGMARMADVLTAANNAALGTVEDFAKAMSTRAGGAIRQYGLSIEQGVSALMAFASQNIKGARAGEQMYIALRDLQRASVKSADAWKKHGIAVYDASGNLRSMGDILEDIGTATKGMNAQQKFAFMTMLGFQDRSKGAIQAIMGLGKEMEDYAEILRNKVGAAQSVAEKQMAAHANQMKQFRGELEVIAIRLYKAFVPVLLDSVLPVLKTFASHLENLAKWFQNLPSSVRLAVSSFTLLFAALGPVVWVVGKVMSAYGSLIGLVPSVVTGVNRIVKSLVAWRVAQEALALSHQSVTGAGYLQMYSRLDILKMGMDDAAKSARSFKTDFLILTDQVGRAGLSAQKSIFGLGSAAASAASASTALAGTGKGIALLGTRWEAMAAWAGRALMFIPRLLGPWGMLATAIGVAGAALWKYMDVADRNLDLVGKEISEEGRRVEAISNAIKVYEDLNGKTKLSKEEKEKLAGATKLLADNLALSEDALRDETKAARESIAALKEKNDLRREELSIMRAANGAKIAEATAAMQQARASADAAMRQIDSYKNRNERLMTTQGLWMGVRESTPEEYKAEFARLEGLRRKYAQVEEDQRQLLATLGAHSKDIDLGIDKPKKKDDKGKSFPEGGGKDTGKSDKNKRERESLYMDFLNDYGQLQDALNHAFEDSIPMPVILEEWGSQFQSIGRRAQLFGFQVEDSFKVVMDAVNRADFIESLKGGIFDPSNIKASFDTSAIKNFNDELKNTADEAEAISQKTRKNQEDISKAYGDRTMNAVAALERERQAELENANIKYAANQKFLEAYKQSINEKYDFEIKKAEGTRDTLIARMRDMGEMTVADQKIATRKLEILYEQVFDETAKNGTYSARQVLTAYQNMVNAQRQLAPRFRDAWTNAMSDLVQSMQQVVQTANLSEDSFMAFAANLLGAADAAMKASDVIDTAFMKVKVGMLGMKAGFDGAGAIMAEGLMGLATGIMGGFSAMMQATSGESLAKNMLGGAMTGGMTGAAVGAGIAMMMGKGMAVAGIWGAVAGAIIGIMVAYWRGKEVRSIMKRVGEEWGGEISKGLAETIKKDTRRFGDRVAATLFNMSDVISELGGWEVNLEKNLGKIRDVFVMLETGMFDLAEANHVLTENFPNVIAAIEKLGRVAPPVIAEIIRLNREMGVMNQEIITVVTQQTQKFGDALMRAFGPLVKSYGTLKTDMEAAKKAVEDAQIAFNADRSAENQKTLADAQKELNRLLKLQSEGAATAGDELYRMGRLALTAFNAAIAGGVNVIAALDAIGPALDSIKGMYEGLGLSFEGTPFEDLLGFKNLVNENRTLVDAAGALNEMMMALSITGGLTEEALRDIEAQGMQTFDSLITAGFTENQAIAMMADYLENVYEAHVRMGTPIDENTQRLIAQGIEMGVIQDEQMSMNNILIEGLAAVITALGGTIPQKWKEMLDKAKTETGTLSDTVQTETDQIAGAFQNMPRMKFEYEFQRVGPDVEFPEWNRERFPSDSPTPPDVPALARGGIVHKPTLALIGEGGPEVVRPLSDDLHRNARDGGEVINLYMDGRRVASTLTKTHLSQLLKNHGIKGAGR